MSEQLDQIQAILREQSDRFNQQLDINQQHADRLNGTENRLDRAESILNALAETSARSASELAELRGIVENFAQQLDVFVEEGRQFRIELRGLQTESRRIWEEMQNHRRDGHGT